MSEAREESTEEDVIVVTPRKWGKEKL